MHGTQLVPRAHQRPLELFPAEDKVKVEGARNEELPSGRVAQKEILARSFSDTAQVVLTGRARGGNA